MKFSISHASKIFGGSVTAHQTTAGTNVVPKKLNEPVKMISEPAFMANEPAFASNKGSFVATEPFFAATEPTKMFSQGSFVATERFFAAFEPAKMFLQGSITFSKSAQKFFLVPPAAGEPVATLSPPAKFPARVPIFDTNPKISSKN